MFFLKDLFEDSKDFFQNKTCTVSEVLFLRHLELTAEGNDDDWILQAHALINHLLEELRVENHRHKSEIAALEREYKARLMIVESKSTAHSLKGAISFLEKLIEDSHTSYQKQAVRSQLSHKVTPVNE